MDTRKFCTGEPDYTVCPGTMIRETIESMHMTQKEFAMRMGLSEKHLIDILKGKTRITEETAANLECVTGTPGRIWSQLESQYRRDLLRLAQSKNEEEKLEWLKNIPYNELVKRKRVPATRDKKERINYALRFYGVANIQAWRTTFEEPVCKFRKAPKVANVPRQTGALSAWLRLCELEGSQMECKPYIHSRFQEAVQEIRKLVCLPPDEFVPKMRYLCQNAGVAFVLVPEFPGGHVVGAAKWLGMDKAMIAVNLRGKSLDKFWFTFFHEAGHLLLGNRAGLYLDIDGKHGDEELAADQFASNILIPAEYEVPLAKLANAQYREVEAFARKINIPPSCVIGRLMHEKLIPWNHPWKKYIAKLQWVESEKEDKKQND